jgi:hypothetical protein
MNELDKEITLVRERLANLERERERQLEIKIPNNKLELLGTFIENKKKQIESNNYSKSIPLAQYNDREKISMIEPVYIILKNILERLEILEKQNTVLVGSCKKCNCPIPYNDTWCNQCDIKN